MGNDAPDQMDTMEQSTEGSQSMIPASGMDSTPVSAPVQQMAPTAPVQSTASPVGYTSNPFLVSVDGIIVVLKNNPVPALLANLALGGVVLLSFVLVILLALAKTPVTNILAVLLGATIYLAAIPMASGVNLAIGAASLKDSTITTMGSIGVAAKKLIPYVGLILLTGILGALSMILLIIPGIIFLVRASLAPVVLFEEDAGPIKALKRSFELTKGHFFEMFGALLAGGFLCSGGLLMFTTGVTPLLGRYHQLNALKASQAPKPKVHWLNYFLPGVVLLFVALYIAAIVAFGALASKASSNLNTEINTTSGSDYYNSSDLSY